MRCYDFQTGLTHDSWVVCGVRTEHSYPYRSPSDSEEWEPDCDASGGDFHDN